jgi:hypothetical protein
MQYDFADASTVIDDLETEENMHTYSINQQPHKYFQSNLQDEWKIIFYFL